jgi:hypothetical protein
MKFWILTMIGCAAGLWALLAVPRWLRARRKHDPMEYYAGWGGYVHPIGLDKKITREEADAIAARGNAYLIAFFDADNRLVRVDKILKDALFFRFEYTYHPNGRLKLTKVLRSDGRTKEFEYDQRGRKLPTSPAGIW